LIYQAILVITLADVHRPGMPAKLIVHAGIQVGGTTLEPGAWQGDPMPTLVAGARRRYR
jgi:hypothetical protein